MSDLSNAGFGNHLARPLFREKHRPDMTEAEAEALLKEGLQVSAGCMLLSAQAMMCFIASAMLHRAHADFCMQAIYSFDSAYHFALSFAGMSC